MLADFWEQMLDNDYREDLKNINIPLAIIYSRPGSIYEEGAAQYLSLIHISPRARKLRETVINTGMDELVRLMLAEAENPEKLPCHEAFEPAVDPEDWPQNKWTGRDNYSAIKLKDILPERLWQELIR